MNDDMLSIARRNAPEVARQVGYSNVDFRKGKIQDLALDLEALELWLNAHPVRCSGDFSAMEGYIEELKTGRPLIASDSIDVVVSNCVLNLVTASAKGALFREIFRVLRRGGRAVISDIVSDEEVPEHLQSDPELWSGCISGALRESRFLEAFEAAGFYGVSILERQHDPWRTVEGIEFRSVTVAAYKGKEGRPVGTASRQSFTKVRSSRWWTMMDTCCGEAPELPFAIRLSTSIRESPMQAISNWLSR